jgi:hypothetical protein
MLQVTPLWQIERIAIALRGRHAPVSTRWRKRRASHIFQMNKTYTFIKIKLRGPFFVCGEF